MAPVSVIHQGHLLPARVASICRALLITSATTLIVATTATGDFSFGTDVRVDGGPPGTVYKRTESGGQRCVACLGDTVYVVWKDGREGPDIYFARSLDGGKTFEDEIPIDEMGMGVTPCLALGPQGDIYVVWEDRRNTPHGQVYFDRSTDGGVTFGPDLLVEDVVTGINYPSLAVCPVTGDLYVVWEDGRLGGAAHAFMSRSEDCGVSFSPGVRVDDTWDYLGAGAPVVAVGPDESVYVGWVDTRLIEVDHVYVARSDDHGQTFGTSVDAMAGRTRFALEVSPSGLVCVSAGIDWQDFEGYHQKLRVARSLDRAVSFENAVTVCDMVVESSLAVDQYGNIFVAFHSLNWEEILFSGSLDGGLSFESPVAISDVWVPDIETRWPSIAARGAGDVYVVWSDSRNAPVYHAYRDVFLDVGAAPTSIGSDIPSSHANQGITSPELILNPNPSCRDLTLSYSLPSGVDGSDCCLEIYDVQGRRIRAFPVSSGGQEVSLTWDGRDSSGNLAPPGVYFLWLRGQHLQVGGRVVLAR